MLRHVVLVTAAALLLAVPVAAARHWESPAEADHVADSGCLYSQAGCVVAYLCTGDAPAAPADLATHCASRAAGEALDVALWLPRFLWDWLVDYPTEAAEELPYDANVELCEASPDPFCANPPLPEHAPLDDPVDDFPL